MSDRPPEEGAAESRIPPHDIPSEAAVLSACLIDPEALPRIRAIITHEDFYSEAHRSIFEACERLHDSGMPTDTVTVATELRRLERIAQVGGPSYLTQITNAAPAVTRVAAYATTVRVKSRMRDAIFAAQRIVAEGYIGRGNDHDFLVHAYELMTDATRMSDADILKKNNDALSEIINRIIRARKTGSMLVGLPTGLDAWDRLTLGLQKEKLWVVAARPGKGKSALGGTVALNVASQRVGVLVFSLEMGREEWLERNLSADAEIDGTRMKLGNVTPHEWTKIHTSAAKLVDIPLFIEDKTTVTVREMRERALGAMEQAHRMGTALGLIVVDYLQKMTVAERDRGKGRYEQVGDFAKGMKDMARETKLPIFCLAQLRRTKGASAKEAPSMDDLRESGDIEQEADVITLIHQTEVKDEDDNKVSEGRSLIVDKARGGRVGVVKVGWRPELTKFVNGPESPEPY
jgi:replicative DNA helicase